MFTLSKNSDKIKNLAEDVYRMASKCQEKKTVDIKMKDISTKSLQKRSISSPLTDLNDSAFKLIGKTLKDSL